MVEINGKEYGLFFTVGARLKYEEWLLKNPKAPMTAAKLYEACCMSEAYADINGGEVLKMEDFMKLPNSEAVKTLQAVALQEQEDSEITVEAESKNVKKVVK